MQTVALKLIIVVSGGVRNFFQCKNTVIYVSQR